MVIGKVGFFDFESCEGKKTVGFPCNALLHGRKHLYLLLGKTDGFELGGCACIPRGGKCEVYF